jgi:hypothetical protein
MLLGIKGAVGGAVVGAVAGVATFLLRHRATAPVQGTHGTEVTKLLNLNLEADTEDAICTLAGLVGDHMDILRKLAHALADLEGLAVKTCPVSGPRAIMARSISAHAAARVARDAIVDLEVTIGKENTVSKLFTTQADVIEGAVANLLFNVNVGTSTIG